MSFNSKLDVMRALSQLFREFWLPLLLGIAWTAYNFVDRPFTQWTVREFINVFGPTFFFISWLVAQWYRVRKQQRVEDGLSEIQRDVRAIHAPIFPCGLFLSLRMEATDKDLSSLFEEAPGFRAFSPDKPPPPPPLGLPPGLTQGRVIHPNGYIEYLNGSMAAAGFFKQEQPGYNIFERKVSHTVSALPRDAIASAKTRSHPLLSVPSVEVDVTFPNKSSSAQSVRLVSALKTHEIGDVLALDSTVLVDHLFKLVADPAHQPMNWNLTDLQGAKLRLVLKLFFIEGLSHLPSTSWPVLHNFQLWLGPRADRIFSLDPARLKSQSIRNDPNPIAHGQAECVELVYEASIDKGTYTECLLATA